MSSPSVFNDVVVNVRSVGTALLTLLIIGTIIAVVIYIMDEIKGFAGTNSTVAEIINSLSDAVETGFGLFGLVVLVLMLALIIGVLLKITGLDIFRAQ